MSDESVAEPPSRARVKPAFYAAGRGVGGARDWLSLLHPPYTAWHLSYVAIGAALAAPMRFDRLGWALLAFFLALGVGAHALDEMHGQPLRTGITRQKLLSAAILTIGAAAAIGWFVGGLHLLPFIVVGAVSAFGYNLEWFGGMLHNALGFSLSWGAFPLLTGYFSQHWTISSSAIIAAAAAVAITLAQRALSTPARWLRRQAREANLAVTMQDGSLREFSSSDLVKPIENALKAISWGMVALAVALVVAQR